jgi:4-methyl-5(b-hydroxyethyl)-thiazole monophosphate biosynthesis
MAEANSNSACSLYRIDEGENHVLIFPEEEKPKTLQRHFWEGPFEGTMEPSSDFVGIVMAIPSDKTSFRYKSLLDFAWRYYGHNIKAPMKADALYADVAEREAWDVVILPGGGEGTENLKAFKPLAGLAKRQRAEGRLLAAICAAPVALVATDAVESGIHVTCYPACQLDLDRQWTAAPVVEESGVITGQAPGSAMLFALVILKALAGETVTDRVARGLVTDVLQ